MEEKKANAERERDAEKPKTLYTQLLDKYISTDEIKWKRKEKQQNEIRTIRSIRNKSSLFLDGFPVFCTLFFRRGFSYVLRSLFELSFVFFRFKLRISCTVHKYLVIEDYI